MSSSILKYGQIIRICSNEQAMIDQNSSRSFITSKSFTDQNIYFQVYDPNYTLLADTINIQNYRQSLFQVLPTSSFQINDELNAIKNPIKRKQAAPRAKTQEQQFKAMISQKRGKYISFGDRVVFKHVDSQYYMYGSFDCATSGIGAFKIQLRKQLSQKIIYQLMSFRTYEKQGDEISINAPFRIYHCQTQCYLSYCFETIFIDKKFKPFEFSLEEFVDYPEIKTSDIQEDRIEEYRRSLSEEDQQQKKINNGRFLIINENIPKRVFKLQLHNQFQMKPNKQNIKNHDIVFFIHTKDDKYLCCSNFKKKSQSSKSDIFIKKRKNQTDLNHIFDGLWQIQQVKLIEDKSAQRENDLGKSRTPQTKKNQLSIPMGNSSLARSDVGLIKTTVISPQQGAVQVGNIVQSQKLSKTKMKKKYIIRHLVSGRIIVITKDKVVKVQKVIPPKRTMYDHRNESQRPLLLQSVDSNLVDGSLVQFTHKKMQNNQQIVKYFLDVKQQKKQQRKKSPASIMEIKQQVQYFQNSHIQQDFIDQIDATYSSYFQTDQLQMTRDSGQHGFRIYKVEEQIKQLALYVLSSQQIIYKFCMSLSRLKQYVLNQEKYGKKSQSGLFDLKKQLTQDINVQILNNVINVLKGLIGFIYDCDYNLIAQSGNSPNSKKQRIFDQLGMIQLMTRLVEIIDIYDDNLQNLIAKSQSEYKKVRSIYVLAYQLLQSIAANNYLQKIKISKYLEKYLDQVKKQSNKVVYRSIQEVLDGNYLALEKKVSSQYIKQLIEQFKVQNPDPADLYFLSRLCLCKQRTVIKNQNAVYEFFYKNDIKRNKKNEKINSFERKMQQSTGQDSIADNKFKFRQDQGKMQILSKISSFSSFAQFRTLSQLYEQCQMSSDEGVIDPQKGHWNYFLQYLNLLADICVHRNATPLQYILDNLPSKTLVAFLHQPTVKKRLLFQPFIRLVHHAFVQNRKFQQINRITKVKDWNDLGKLDIPKSSTKIDSELQKTKTLIMDYIKRINKYQFSKQDNRRSKQIKQKGEQKQPQTIDFNPQDKLKLINVKTFLEILKSTLNLGFWPTMDKMMQIVPFILKVMKFDIQYAKMKITQRFQQDKRKGQNQHLSQSQHRQMVLKQIKQQLTLNKPNIVLLVQCKILAAQILNIIIDYQFNVRVSIITKYFKDVMQMNIDLSKYKFNLELFSQKCKHNPQYKQIQPLNQKQQYLLNSQLWKDKVKQIIEQRDIFKLCQNQLIDKSLTMFETFVYENVSLTNMVFEIITRITNQRREILKTFKDIIFVAGGNFSKLADRGVKVTRSVLLNLTNVTIKDVKIITTPNCLWEVVRADGRQINDPRKPLGAIQQLAFLTIAMMKKGNPTLQRASKFYKDDQLYPFEQLMKYKKDDIDTQQDGSYLVITQKDENLPLNQNLIKSQDHHLLIIDFIKIMSDIKQDQDKDQMRLLPRRALHAAYNFLTVLVWNHNENKKQLQQLLKISECHLKFNMGTIDFYKQMYKNNKKLVKKSDISRIVRHIIGLANDTDIRLYQKSKLLDFLRIIVIFDDQGYDVNQNTVMQIISQYQVSNNNQIVILKANDELSKRITDHLDDWMKQFQEMYRISTQDYTDLNIGPQLFYIATFFEIFSALIQNQNVVNIGKCTNMHPLQFLLNYLTKIKYCWPIVRHLRAYVNKLYYFKGRQMDTTLFDTFINIDLKIIRDQLRGIVELICNTPQYNIIKLKNPIRYTYLGSYVFLCLQQILNSLDLLFNDINFFSYITMKINQTSDNKLNNPPSSHLVLQIIQMDQYLQKTIDGRFINRYLAKVSKILKTTVSNIPLKMVESFNDESKKQMNQNMKQNNFGGDDVPFKKNYVFHEEKGLWRHLIDWNSFKEQENKRARLLDSIQKGIVKDPAESKQAESLKKRDYLLDIIYMGNIQKKIQRQKAKRQLNQLQSVQQVKNQQQSLAQNNLPKNLTTSTSNRFRVKNQRFQNTQIKNMIINNRRKKLVKLIQIDQQLQKITIQETQQKLYKFFSEIDNKSKQKYQDIDVKFVVGSADVIKSIVKMNENDPNFIKPEYKRMVVKLLTNYIQRQNPIFEQKVQQWYLNQKQSQNVKVAQDFLNSCGCASFLCSLIINDLRTDIKMGNSILTFGISLLLGHNKNNQQAIFKILKQDQKNIFILQLQNLIKSCGSSIANYVHGKSQKDYSMMNYSDTYDFYNDSDKSMTRKFVYIPQTVEEQKQFEEKVVALQNTFIFLRVLCEGNNQIKNFIRQQITNDQQKKVKNQSVNFISLGVSQIKRMFLNFNIDIVKVPFSILDFIIQVTQIPCIQNQLFLCESSFFHDFANLQMLLDLPKKVSKKQEEKKEQNKQSQKQPNHPKQKQQKIKIYDNFNNIAVINKLFSSCIKNVMSCLQGNTQQIYNLLSSQDLCRFFVKCLSFYVRYLPLLERLPDYHIQEVKDLENLLKRNKLHENFFLDLFQVTSVIIKLKHKTPNVSFSSKIDYYLKKQQTTCYYNLIQKNLLGIQITMDQYDQLSTDRNQILFFPRHGVFTYLSHTTRSRIMQQINRSTQRDKIIGLFNSTNQISSQIDYNYYLDNQYTLNNLPVSISDKNIAMTQNIGMYIATLICVMMIIFSSVIYYPYEHIIQYNLGMESMLIKVISYVQFTVAIVFYLLWTKNHLHLAIGKYQQDIRAQKEGVDEEKVQTDTQSTMMKIMFGIPFAKNIYCLAKYDQEFSSVLMYMFGSFMGCFYKMEWFSLLLFNLLMKKMDVLKNIMMAITTNLKMLGMLSLLGIAFITIFSIFSIHYYSSSMYPQSIPKQHCQSLTNCIIQLYIRQQIGQDMQSFQTGRFISDMIYTIFMDMLFGNIVGGVLIDTFAELRQRGDQIEQDKKGKCFICGIERETLEKRNQDLKTHYKVQYHKLWNYVFYRYYLQKQQKKTGLELIIQEKINNQNVSWIPNSASQGGDVGEKIQELQRIIKEQSNLIKAIESHQ